MSDLSRLYEKQISNKFLIPEGFITRALLSNYPIQMVPKYKNANVLDLSCGYGRNLPLLCSLHKNIYATEIDSNTVIQLTNYFKNVKFSQARINSLPFKDEFFEIIVACNTCYYLDYNMTFIDNLQKIFKLIKKDGCFLGSVVGNRHSILKNSKKNKDGSYAICKKNANNRYSSDLFKESYNIHAVNSKKEILNILKSFSKDIIIGSIIDELNGYIREIYYFSCIKK